LGLAVAPEIVRTFGDVSCDIRYDDVVKGRPVTPQATQPPRSGRRNGERRLVAIGLSAAAASSGRDSLSMSGRESAGPPTFGGFHQCVE
jgi:hypothetical protein